MHSASVTYPVSPKNVDQTLIQPNATFRKNAIKVLFSIFIFILVYVVLMAAAILLAIVCAIGGAYLIVSFPNFLTLMLGIGLGCLGVLVVFYLLKFLFKRTKTDRSHLIEVTERDQPELFQFVRNLTQETKAPFPKRIYLSPEVNACVFYDSSFLSMFFPVGKNLQIGLGLVNSVNISEFKAIMAHEFGHFSQRSMKLGSYVYNVNQVIFNLLYDNKGYGEALEGFANVSGYFAIFATITVKIIEAIQWVLRNVYTFVNRNYLSLSREMEFHADSVSAYVTGSDHLASSLRRIEVADVVYQRLLEYYDKWLKENLKADNIYLQHTEMMQEFAHDHDLPVKHGLPQVTARSFSRFNRSRIVIKDQWASHPSTDDREAHLNKLNFKTDADPTSAWVIFRNAEQLQKQVTERIYKSVEFTDAPSILDLVSFKARCAEEFGKYRLDKRYKGFYTNRFIPSNIDIGNLNSDLVTGVTDLNSILTDEVVNLPLEIAGLESDIHTLQMIKSPRSEIRTFDFEGRRLVRKDADELINKLDREVVDKKQALYDADTRVVAFFLQAADKHGKREDLIKQYRDVFEEQKLLDQDVVNYQKLMSDLQPIFAGSVEILLIKNLMTKLALNEVLIKERFKVFLDDQRCQDLISPAARKRAEEYLFKDHEYFREPNFNQPALTLLMEATTLFVNIVSDRSLQIRKMLLDEQLLYID